MHAPPPLLLEPRPSTRFAFLLLAIHGIGAAGLALSPLPRAASFAGVGLILLSLGFALWRHAFLRASSSAIRVQTRADGRLEFLTREGEWVGARLLPDTTLFPFFAVLALKPETGRRRSLVIFQDALPPEDWRRLCVWLRWAALAMADDPKESPS